MQRREKGWETEETSVVFMSAAVEMSPQTRLDVKEKGNRNCGKRQYPDYRQLKLHSCFPDLFQLRINNSIVQALLLWTISLKLTFIRETISNISSKSLIYCVNLLMAVPSYNS